MAVTDQWFFQNHYPITNLVTRLQDTIADTGLPYSCWAGYVFNKISYAAMVGRRTGTKQ